VLYALSTAGTSTATGQESLTCLSLTIAYSKQEEEEEVEQLGVTFLLAGKP